MRFFHRPGHIVIALLFVIFTSRIALSSDLDQAEALYKSGKITQAFLAYHKIIHRHATKTDALIKYGKLALSQAKLHIAQSAFLKAEDLNPTLKDLQDNLGHVHYALNQPQKAAYHFNKSSNRHLAKPLHHMKDLFVLSNPDRIWRIPMKERTAFPVVQVTLNHRLKTYFYIDTTRYFSVVDHTIANHLKRFSKSNESGLSLMFQGGLHINQVPIHVEALPQSLRAASGGLPIGGVLGLDFLSQFVTTIDYKHHQLILSHRSRNTHNPLQKNIGVRTIEHPFWLMNHRLLVTTGQVNHANPGLFILHTGYWKGSFAGTDSVFHKAAIAPSEPYKDSHHAAPFTVNKLSLGSDLVAYNQPAHHLKSMPFRVKLDIPILGILGHGFLKHTRITFDFDRMKLIFQFEAAGASFF